MSTNKFQNIILVRHGENIFDKTIENNLLPLSEEGLKQAETAAKIINNNFDIVISSNSLRSMQTANIISNNHNLIVDSRLIERGWGNDGHDGTESDNIARNRFKLFFEEILNKYEGKRILIVSHGSLIKLAQDVIENKIIQREIVNNCTIIMYDQKKIKNVFNVSDNKYNKLC